MKTITYVIPCYNEEESLPEMYSRLSAIPDTLPSYGFEFLFVNDGSTDSTDDLLDEFAANDERVKVIHLACDCGHQNALTAGLDFASGDIIITIDADLQDPPELVHEFVAKIDEGYDVVHAQRTTRPGETRFKLISAWLFYYIISRFASRLIVRNSGDFRAMTRKVQRSANAFREPHRFLRGSFATIGFRQCVIQYDWDERFAGETKYPLRALLRLAFDAVLSFSPLPIRMIFVAAMLLLAGSVIYAAYSLTGYFVYDRNVEGWPTITILITFFSALNLFALAGVGEYVARIFEQGQRRPLYWIMDVRNISLRNIDAERAGLHEVGVARRALSEDNPQ